MRIFIGAINCSLCRDEATDVRIAGVVGSGRALFSPFFNFCCFIQCKCPTIENWQSLYFLQMILAVV
jgi:hypothetical protein